MSDQSTNIRPGARPYTIGRGHRGLTIIHGLGGSPGGFRDWAESLDPVRYTVSGVLLAGHGARPVDLARTHMGDWRATLDAAIDEMQKTTDHVFLLGASFGAVMALDAAIRRRDLSGLIMVNPALVYRGGRWFDLVLHLGRRLHPYLPKPGVTTAEKAHLERTGSLRAWPITTLLETKRVIVKTIIPQLQTIECPVLSLHSQSDNYVDVRKTREVIGRLIRRLDTMTIPFHGHRPFRDQTASGWLRERITEFMENHC